MKTKKRFVAIVMVAMAVVLCMVAGCGTSGGKKVNLDNYISVEFSGTDGEGTAHCGFDDWALEDDLFGENMTDYEEMRAELIEDCLYETVDYELDRTGGLSNGDKVTVTVSYDRDVLDSFGYKVTGSKTLTFTVEGLD